MHEELTHRIIGAAMRVHRGLGPGFLESVYHRALFHELFKERCAVESAKRLVVTYDDVVVGEFEADLLVEGMVLIELKAVQTLNTAHGAQLVNYLAATGLNVGLLLNFGAYSLEYKRKHRTFIAPDHTDPPDLHDTGRPEF